MRLLLRCVNTSEEHPGCLALVDLTDSLRQLIEGRWQGFTKACAQDDKLAFMEYWDCEKVFFDPYQREDGESLMERVESLAVGVCGAPDELGELEEIRMDTMRMCINNGRVWWEGYPHRSDHRVETWPLTPAILRSPPGQ